VLYAVGGIHDGRARGGGTWSSVERYDPAANRWTEVKPMRSERGGAGVAAICADEQGLPAGWECRYDPSSARYLYVHLSKKVAQWTQPTDGTDDSAADSRSSSKQLKEKPASAFRSGAPRALGLNWASTSQVALGCRELTNPSLQRALAGGQLAFSVREWNTFNITDLRPDDFIEHPTSFPMIFFKPAPQTPQAPGENIPLETLSEHDVVQLLITSRITFDGAKLMELATKGVASLPAASARAASAPSASSTTLQRSGVTGEFLAKLTLNVSPLSRNNPKESLQIESIVTDISTLSQKLKEWKREGVPKPEKATLLAAQKYGGFMSKAAAEEALPLEGFAEVAVASTPPTRSGSPLNQSVVCDASPAADDPFAPLNDPFAAAIAGYGAPSMPGMGMMPPGHAFPQGMPPPMQGMMPLGMMPSGMMSPGMMPPWMMPQGMPGHHSGASSSMAPPAPMDYGAFGSAPPPAPAPMPADDEAAPPPAPTPAFDEAAPPPAPTPSWAGSYF